MKAFAYRDGRIGFGRSSDPRAIEFCHGHAKTVREVVTALARHSRTSHGALYVPGIPEAGTNGSKAVSALIAFAAECAKSMNKQRRRAA